MRQTAHMLLFSSLLQPLNMRL
ncbi:hypothetical protein cypCar_00049221 [Cyprinus carpio]|nr:hypothetical protein cypCar_00049221 [Cyprinus carpio]